MIAVDTSVIVAILCDEPDAHVLRSKLNRSNGGIISAGNIVELQLVLAGIRKIASWEAADALLREYNIHVHPFDEMQAHIAREAAVRFGKGRHKAALNFGDCFAYALAKSQGLPLLCKGGDFALTDIEIA